MVGGVSAALAEGLSSPDSGTEEPQGQDPTPEGGDDDGGIGGGGGWPK